MKEKYCAAEDEVNSILFSDEYLRTMKDIGLSREFRLNEQIRKQRECIRFLAEKLDELRNEIISSRNTGKTLERIA